MATVADVKRLSRSISKKVASSKQDKIGDGSLTIANTNGLQAAIDAKQPTITQNLELVAPNVGNNCNITSSTDSNHLVLKAGNTAKNVVIQTDNQTTLTVKPNGAVITRGNFTSGGSVTDSGGHTLDNMVTEPSSFPVGDSNDYIVLMNATTKATSLVTGGLAISGLSNGIACGGAALNSGNVETTGACNAAGGFNSTNGGLHVSGNITTTGGVITDGAGNVFGPAYCKMISHNQWYGGNVKRIFVLDSVNMTVGSKLSGNTSTNRITVNTDGVYKIRVRIHSQSDMPNRALEVYVYKNGSQVEEIYDLHVATLGTTSLIGTELDLSAADYIQIYIKTITNNLYQFEGTFSMEFIGTT